ncbi:hypothetical protein GCM10009529_02520 [Micropruina glycogenica]
MLYADQFAESPLTGFQAALKHDPAIRYRDVPLIGDAQFFCSGHVTAARAADADSNVTAQPHRETRRPIQSHPRRTLNLDQPAIAEAAQQ